jgi:succinyl-diaminopimelate desuccinylase
LQRSLASLLANYPVAVEEVWQTTVNIARIETPNRTRNQIPDLAEAWLDIRFPPEDADLNGKTVDEIASYLAAFCEPGVSARVDDADPPHHANRDRPEIRLLREAVESQGYSAEFLRKHGAADGRFYYQRGVDAVIFGIGGEGLHGPSEFADLTTIAPYYQALTGFLNGLR